MVVLHESQFPSTCRDRPLKRQRPDETSRDNTQHVNKKRKHHPSIPPPRFWDRLSRSFLTKNALRELNRRNTTEHRAALPSPSRRTRRARREDRPCPVQEFFQQSSPIDKARLRRFARQGGPHLHDLRGYRQPSNPAMSSSQPSLRRRKRGSQSTSQSNTTPNTTTTRSTGPYDRAFQQHLIDNNCFPPGYEYPDGDEPDEPENIDEIRRALEQPRASLSPSRFTNKDFKSFQRADDNATKESRVLASVIPIIEGEPQDGKCVASDVPFTDLEHLTDGSLVYAKPDLYYGARPEQLHKDVRHILGNLIVPSTQDDLPIAPNNFVEIKGPDGSLAVATRQAQYDAALGTRGFHSLQSHGTAEPCYDNKAYTLAWTYHAGALKAYTSHPVKPQTPGAHPTYAMTRLKGWLLTNDPETFRQGAAAFRNGRDWAKKQRDQVIAQANKSANGPALRIESDSDDATKAGQGLDETTQVVLIYESDTSADELALEFEPPAKRSRSPEKQASTTESISIEDDTDRKGRDALLMSKPNLIAGGKRFNPAPIGLSSDDES